MKIFNPLRIEGKARAACHGSTLLIAIIFVLIFSIMVGSFAALTSGTGRLAYRQGNFLRNKAAADGMADLIYGRFSRWVSKHNGITPSIGDTLVADAINPAILDPDNLFKTSTNVSTAPAGSDWLANFSVVVKRDAANKLITPRLVPVMPDDSEPTTSADAFPDAATANTSTYFDKVAKFYTVTPGIFDRGKASSTITYKLVLTVQPVGGGSVDADPVTVVRYFQKTSVNPFEYGRFNNGSLQDSSNPRTYTGPLYSAYDMSLTGGFTVNGNVEYGHNFYGRNGTQNDDSNITFLNGGTRRQTTLIELIPDLVDVLHKDGSGNRQASFESGADDFSVREVIEVPNSAASDKAQIASRRIYNQASLRVHVNNSAITFTKVNPQTYADIPLTNNAHDVALKTALKAAITTHAATDTSFYDANLNSTVKATDVNVGTLKGIMDGTNGGFASDFPNSVIYVWDDTTGQTTGVRLYNGGELPNNGLVVGTDSIAYIKGDYNTGTKLLGATDFNSGTVIAGTEPNSSNGLTVSATSTEQDRRRGGNTHVNEYIPVPAGVFADGVTELSQNWTDGNSRNNNRVGRNITLNMAEGLGSGRANELNSDDTFHNAGSATIHWLEQFNNTRRTTSGSEMQLYHSLYYRNFTNAGGGMRHDTSYNPAVIQSLGQLLNWGSIVFSRGRYYRYGGIPTQQL